MFLLARKSVSQSAKKRRNRDKVKKTESCRQTETHNTLACEKNKNINAQNHTDRKGKEVDKQANKKTNKGTNRQTDKHLNK